MQSVVSLRIEVLLGSENTMADEGEVLSKLEAFLVRHQHVSLVELDALISTLSSPEGTTIFVPSTLT